MEGADSLSNFNWDNFKKSFNKFNRLLDLINRGKSLSAPIVQTISYKLPTVPYSLLLSLSFSFTLCFPLSALILTLSPLSDQHRSSFLHHYPAIQHHRSYIIYKCTARLFLVIILTIPSFAQITTLKNFLTPAAINHKI
jgi:hypothetical protein